MDLLWNRAEQPAALLVLAHGAGAPMDSDFMNAMAEALADRGISVVRFEFPYMARRRQEQRKFPPNRAPQLLAHFRDVLAALPTICRSGSGANPWAGAWHHCWQRKQTVRLSMEWWRWVTRFTHRENRRKPALTICHIWLSPC